MAALNPANAETARKTCTLILQRLASVGQNEVAIAAGVSEATVSRMKDQVPAIVAMLTRLGLQVLPDDVKAYPQETLAAVLTLAGERMQQLKTPDALAATPGDG